MPTTDVIDFLDLLWQTGEIRELRVPQHNRYVHTASGYFDSPKKLAIAAKTWDGKSNVFVSLNPVDRALLARANNRIVERAQNTTADIEVLLRRWLLIDIDADRPSGISSSNEELGEAHSVADATVAYLTAQGWPQPIVAMSGNGYYLLYHIDLPNDSDSIALVKSVLESLARLLNSSHAHIDVSVDNAAQLVGLIGAMKVKGDNMPDRPHRASRLMNVPEVIEVVTRDQLEAVSAGTSSSSKGNPGMTENVRARISSLADTLTRHAIEFREQPPDANGVTWYHVRQCPFHDDGRAFECGVGQKLPDGPYAGHCFHPEGRNKTWHDWKAALNLHFGRSPSPGLSNGHLPEIMVSSRHMRDIVQDAWKALSRANVPASLFEYGSTVAEVRRLQHGSIKIEPLSTAGLKWYE